MISVAIFTLDEEANLPRCLASLGGCHDVVVVDSFSSDHTVDLARARGARVFQHAFTGFGDQRMWALQNIPFANPWLLILDADERVPPSLWEEMLRRVAGAPSEVAAFRLKRRFFWEGRWLRHANLYPTWVVRLVRVGQVAYVNRGHAETQQVEGRVEPLEEDLLDENLKGLIAWRERQRRYAEQEARHEVATGWKLHPSDLWRADPLARRAAWKKLAHRLPMRGLFYFLYSAVLRGGFLDGWTGLRFCLEKARFQQHTDRIARRLRREPAKIHA